MDYAQSESRGIDVFKHAPSLLLLVVVVPDAVVVGHAQSASRFEETVHSIGQQLKLNDWLAERRCDVQLTDSVEHKLGAENMVIAARGHGWAPSTSARAVDMEEMIAQMRTAVRAPRLVLVCFKYGAQSAAERLAAKGTPLVIWIAVDVHDPAEAELFDVILLPVLELLQADVTESTLHAAHDCGPCGRTSQE